MRHMPGRWSPTIVGAPRLGRYQLFGNLFPRIDHVGGVLTLCGDPDRAPLKEALHANTFPPLVPRRVQWVTSPGGVGRRTRCERQWSDLQPP